MALNVIDVNLMRAMFIAGAQKLEDNKETINMLNVFPVPDGDTGTNMSMTLQGAVREIAALPDDASKEQVCKAISSGSLRGARGNSGVILSQFLRGFIKNIREEERPLEAPVLAVAMAKATETAYKAVMKPKEGTILTVVKAMSEKALELTETDGEDESIVKEYDLVSLFKQVIDAGYETLQKTPEMLPVLKEAGVVDSGGEGLMCFMSGMYEAIPGIVAGEMPALASKPQAPVPKQETVIPKEHIRKPISTDDIKFGYCTEFLVLTKGEVPVETENEFKAYLSSIGDSIVCVSDEDIIKVHVHTNDPGLAIQKGLTYGMLSNLKIDNMRLEHQNTLVTQAELEKASDEVQEPADEAQNAPEPVVEAVPEPEPVMEEKAAPEPAEKPVEEEAKPGFVAVVSGAGLAKIFKDMGVDVVIEGGQTMNPSTDDIMCAIESIQADPIYILPNNKNIIMSANQARDLTEDRTVYVIPTKTIPQGISSMMSTASSTNMLLISSAVSLSPMSSLRYCFCSSER